MHAIIEEQPAPLVPSSDGPANATRDAARTNTLTLESVTPAVPNHTSNTATTTANELNAQTLSAVAAGGLPPPLAVAALQQPERRSSTPILVRPYTSSTQSQNTPAPTALATGPLPNPAVAALKANSVQSVAQPPPSAITPATKLNTSSGPNLNLNLSSDRESNTQSKKASAPALAFAQTSPKLDAKHQPAASPLDERSTRPGNKPHKQLQQFERSAPKSPEKEKSGSANRLDRAAETADAGEKPHGHLKTHEKDKQCLIQ